MPNYYDFLGVSTSASQSEINNAFDQQYNHWRRLITHHEQEKVEEATRALRILEQAHNTLSDPASREKYNASIGLGEQVAGLGVSADLPTPGSIPLAAALPPMPPAQGQQRADAWVCPRCQTANAIGTRHCKNCGLAVGIDCPACGKLTEAATKYCSNCGANIQDTLRKKQALEEEQRRQSEAQQAERLRLERDQERIRAEQASQNLVKQKQKGRRSCFVLILIMLCCVAAGVIVPMALGSTNLLKSSAGLIPQLPTADPFIAAQAPTFSGTKISVTSKVTYVSDKRFQIGLNIQNLTKSAATLAFLTSDIVVTDDLGNIFPYESDTQPVRDELDASGSYSSKRNYSLNMTGSLDPRAKTINVSFPSLTEGEQPFQLAILLTPIEKISAGFDAKLSDNHGDSLRVSLKFTNNSPYFFILRLNSSDPSVMDDLGNVYQIRESEANRTIARPLDGTNRSPVSDEYQWVYTPGLDPRAKQLNIKISLMGQPFSAQIPLSVSNEKIRYEAQVAYAYPDSQYFTVEVTAFNLGDTDFVLRLDGNQASITQDGTTFNANPENKRVGEIGSPGNSTRFQLKFDGALTNQNNLLLILPVVSGTENIKISVTPKN